MAVAFDSWRMPVPPPLGDPTWLLTVVDVMIVLHVGSAYTIYTFPVYDVLESWLLKAGWVGGCVRVLAAQSRVGGWWWWWWWWWLAT